MDKPTLPPERNAAASVKFGDWQPIESAPKDGTAIWLLVSDHPFIGYCEPAREHFHLKDRWFIKATFKRRDRAHYSADDVYCVYDYDAKPTHWMPLPEPPTEK